MTHMKGKFPPLKESFFDQSDLILIARSETIKGAYQSEQSLIEVPCKTDGDTR